MEEKYSALENLGLRTCVEMKQYSSLSSRRFSSVRNNYNEEQRP